MVAPTRLVRRTRRQSRLDRLRAWLAASGRHRGRRLLALVAAVAVPAMAAPGEWTTLDELGTSSAADAPMPFETPGESFPGSAFFYLEDLPQVTIGEQSYTDEPPASDQGSEEAPIEGAGSAAPAFLARGSGLDKARALQCLTMAIYYEAANEPTEGQRAVAQVVLNRVAHPSYPNSVCGVVFQGSERRTGCQFSFTCDGSLARVPARASWDRARGVAAAALGGYVHQAVGLATHYHATYVYPYWAPSLQNVGTIGLHTFYKWRGAAGRKDAFAALYRGGEPAAAPHPRAYSDPAGSAPDPVVLAQAYEAARAKALTQAKSYAPPPPPVYAAAVTARGGDRVYTAENLPEASGIKAEYANSGRWIAAPTKASSAASE